MIVSSSKVVSDTNTLRLNFLAVVSFLLLQPMVSYSQNISDLVTSLFETYHSELAPEKVYLHTNRERFTLGDTLYFSAFVVDGINHAPSYISGVLYVDLISPKNNIIESHKLKIDSLGRTHGDFNLSIDWSAGEYRLRAYTRYQMNFDQDYFFSKSIKVLPTLERHEQVDESPSKMAQVQLQFFPEGGELVAEVSNRVAFKATDQYGNPLDINGKVFDESGNEVANLSSEHDGMGMIYLIPEEGKNYTCAFQYGGTTLSQPLPVALSSGYLLGVRNINDRWHISVKPVMRSIAGGFLVVHCRGKIINVFAPRSGTNDMNLSLEEGELPTGIIHLTFFDPKRIAVAERLICNENMADQVSLSIATDKEIYNTRSKVKLNLTLADVETKESTLATLSTTVIPRKLRVNPNETIASFLLFSSDLKGYIHEPAYYLNPANPNRRKHIDLLMMTHGWRRFTWEELLEKDTPEPQYMFEQGIRIEGTVASYTNRTKVMQSDLRLKFIEDPLFEMETASLENGLFWFDKLSFTGTLNAYIKTLSDNKRKRKKDNIKFNSWIRIHETETPDVGQEYRIPYKVTSVDQPLINRGEELFDISAAFDQNIIVLDEVSISEFALSEEEKRLRFRQGMIYPDPDHRVMLDSFPHYYPSLFEYLYTVPGVQINSTAGIDTLHGEPVSFTQPYTVSIRGAQSFDLYSSPLYVLDGIEISELEAARLNMLNILFIDVLRGPSAMIYGSRGSNGVIALYSRQSGDKRYIEEQDYVGMAIFELTGYTPRREFYKINYDNPSDHEKIRPDYRSTIHWNPNIPLKNGIGLDDFYTSDEKGEFIIYSEGMTIDGKVFIGSTGFEVQ